MFILNPQRPDSNLAEQPAIVVVWSPDLMTAEEYAELVGAIGDLVRAHGGAGIKLIETMAYEVEKL